MKVTRFLLAAIVAVALLALLAGCGDGSSSSSRETTAAYSQSQHQSKPPAEPEAAGGAARGAYVKEADAVCKANDEVTMSLDAELAKLSGSGKSETPRGEAKLSELLVRLVFLGREEGKELAAIQPPAADTATITRWISTGQEGLSEIEAAALALEKGSASKFGRLNAEGIATLGRAHAIARGYGFKVCGAGAEVQTIR